ncbi:P-loop containing nucleoside triphosphate hydrolase protein [Truncatella angustata]|uniref:Peroxisomal ATPase PEX1 n=1 Tax=Truncatella angustata TaxID=152316 RepID=A0A9P8RH90_9PEZI|nr:P-loop containing nucleoside triphosphate hydrolase protein [Truncatella angustata]KAH6645807.1 P-loop containing nucleoside triphosphate hydrolase protein [Truncatella angustata]
MRLTQRIDRDIYQIVLKLENDQAEKTARTGEPPKFTIAGVYDIIKKSNSSLAREKKKPLEDSIYRVLHFRKEERKKDQADDEDEAMDDFAEDSASAQPKERDYFLMNKQLTKGWNVARRARSPEVMATSGATTPAAEAVESAVVTADRQSNGEPKAKKLKTRQVKEKEPVDRTPPAGVSLEDLGGMEDAIELLYNEVTWPMCYTGMYTSANVKPTRGVLLHGPPGCGKTMLANAYAADLGVAFIPVSAPALVAGMSGESEKKIRELYEEAKSLAPCLVFIDELDAIMGKRENAQREMEKRIVAQMLTCMDDLSLDKTGGKPVITLAATNRPDSIDPALRRAGRFNREINIGVPSEEARLSILQALTRKTKLSTEVDLKIVAKLTPGFVGADLEDVVGVASADMMKRTREVVEVRAVEELGASADDTRDYDGLSPRLADILRKQAAAKLAMNTQLPEVDLMLLQEDFIKAVSKVQPSSKREGFTTIPDTTWAQVGALHKVRKELSLAITRPIDTPELFAQFGFQSPSGVLLWGPPGCGKTLLAKAVANEAKANFISVKGPELLNKYVGESERSVRQVFTRARSSAPCILFFDELDALVPRRGDAIAESSARVVNMLLTELDGMDNRTGVYIIGATNRPDMIDPAILRPGRLGTSVFVDLPDDEGRIDILKTRVRNALPLTSEEQLTALEPIARRCHGFSGADLENLLIAAAKAGVERFDHEGGEAKLTLADWAAATETVKPSVSEQAYKKFVRLRDSGWS